MSRWKTPAAFFPWPWVQKAIDGIEGIVYRHAVKLAHDLHLGRARSCPGCGRAPSDLFWVSISDPEEAWDKGTGRVGFLTLCEDCRLQVDFLVDEELTELQAKEWRAGRFYHFG
jgi:hypothetical protein